MYKKQPFKQISMSDFFKTGAVTPPPAATPAANPPPAMATAGAKTAEYTAKLEGASAGAEGGAAAASPLDSFKGLWETAATDSKAAPAGVLPEFTAEQLGGALSKASFTTGITPELMQKAMTDPNTFAEVMNSVARMAVTQSVMASRGLIEQGIGTHGERLKAELPTMVRSNNVSDKLSGNVNLNHPSVKPMVDLLRAQIEVKNPTASATEVASLVNNYFADFAKQLGGVPQAAQGKSDDGQNPAQTDWYKELGL